MFACLALCVVISMYSTNAILLRNKNPSLGRLSGERPSVDTAAEFFDFIAFQKTAGNDTEDCIASFDRFVSPSFTMCDLAVSSQELDCQSKQDMIESMCATDEDDGSALTFIRSDHEELDKKVILSGKWVMEQLDECEKADFVAELYFEPSGGISKWINTEYDLQPCPEATTEETPERMDYLSVMGGIHLDGHSLNEEELARVDEANSKCHTKHCCRLDDGEIDLSPLSNAKCQEYEYLDCISEANECIWDCSLPQTASSKIHYKHIFTGVDRRIAKPVNDSITIYDVDMVQEDDDIMNEDYLSMDVMDECGTSYHLQLTPESIQREVEDHGPSSFASPQALADETFARRLAVLGIEDRFSIQEDRFPYYANVWFSYQTAYTASGRSYCSGALITPKHVLTAGHCVSDGAGNWYSDFKVYPGLNVGNRNNGAKSFGSTRRWLLNEWHLRRNWAADFAIITLNTANTGFGHFGFGYDNGISATTEFEVNGYPSDRFDGKILQREIVRMDYAVWENEMATKSGDIMKGNSGGPVFKRNNNRIYGVVSHIHGTVHNDFVRITKSRFDLICAHLRTEPETAQWCK